jgi:hypothetical protein
MKKFFSYLWPPYSLYLTKQAISKNARNGDPWTRALEELKVDVSSQSEKELEDAEKLASSVLEAEIKRKDVLESKAATFVLIPTVATAITSSIAPLTKDLGLSSGIATIITVCYVIALIHLLVSSWYAITARRAEGYIVLSSTNARDLLTKTRVERIVTRLAYARMNEPALTMKFNRLSVSEDLFLRGLAFLAAATSLTLMAHMARI